MIQVNVNNDVSLRTFKTQFKLLHGVKHRESGNLLACHFFFFSANGSCLGYFHVCALGASSASHSHRFKAVLG